MASSPSSPVPSPPPVNLPGADLRLPSAPTVTNHGNQEVELNIQSVENLGSNLDLDPSSLERGYRYRWVYRAPVKVSRAKARGYRIVDPATHKKIRNFASDVLTPSEDGTITVGDVVLMRVPEEHYRGRRKEIRRRTKDRLTGKGREENRFKAKARETARRAKLSEQVKVITDEDEK